MARKMTKIRLLLIILVRTNKNQDILTYLHPERFKAPQSGLSHSV
jgi:hypothetical protein